ncbi:two-component system response regulator LytT [Dysgonomonadaceae bacterium PH5-43]|nr:two-component system response regulator LytT [Dysgonomonadaceae bacterium PH5-43]
MRVLIIEDEQPAANKLSRLLKEIDSEIDIISVLKSVEESINWFINNPAPELIFMDIQLEDGLSFDIFENCRVETPVIFTTAYDDYALKAFKVNSVDYLLKPVSIQELKTAINKFNNIYKADYAKIESVVRLMQPKTKERFLIKIGERYKSISTTDIDCFYIEERNSFIFTNSSRSYPIDYSLDKIEKMIDPSIFFRVNRNYIINYYAIKDITVYSSNRLKVTLNNKVGEEDILVSRDRVNEFKKWSDQ